MNLPSKVSAKSLALVLGLSVRRIQQLTQDGVLAREKDGYELPLAVQNYLRFMQRKSARVDEKQKDLETQKLEAEIDFKRAKADRAQLELEELEGKMHRAEDVEAAVLDLVYTIRAGLLAMPGALAVEVAQLSSVAEISDAIKQHAHHLLSELSLHQYDPKEYQKRVRDRLGWESDE